MKKKILLIFVFISISIISFISFKLSHKPIIIENNKTKEGISYIEDIKSKKLKEDINRLFLFDININNKINIYNKEKNIENVIKKYGNYDIEAPTLEYDDKITIYKGEEINLLDYISVTDNIDTELDISIDGDYDIDNTGTYNLTYIVSDKSNNTSRGDFILEVIEKNSYNNYNSYSNPTTNNDGTFTTSKGFTGIVKDGITYIDGILIANKSYSLPSWYNPGGLTNETQNAFYQMKSAAALDGINIYVVSGFRSYWDQNYIYNNYVARDGKENADTYSARPGHSEHQSGLAFDLNWISNDFEYAPEGIWLNNNAYKFGFILRYPKGKTYETGYIFEPWHYRYVGADLSYKLFNNGDWITLENYFGINSQYNY